MVTDAIWRKGPGLILRPNPGCTSVIHGRIWSQNNSRSLIPENRFFGWNFYLLKMINSMSLLTCPPDSFPGMTELHAGNDSSLFQDSLLLLHLWPIFVKHLHQLWDKFRMLVLPFFFDTHHTLWATIQIAWGVEKIKVLSGSYTHANKHLRQNHVFSEKKQTLFDFRHRHSSFYIAEIPQ